MILKWFTGKRALCIICPVLTLMMKTLCVMAYLACKADKTCCVSNCLTRSPVLVTVFAVCCHLGMWPSIALGEVARIHTHINTGTLLSLPCAGLLYITYFENVSLLYINLQITYKFIFPFNIIIRCIYLVNYPIQPWAAMRGTSAYLQSEQIGP